MTFPYAHDLLHDKNALVTGSTRGLGRTMADWLARAGANVFVTGRSSDAVETVADELRGSGSLAWGIAADLSDPAEAHRLAREALEMVGRIDILVNNAGFSKPQSFLTVSDGDWTDEICTNARAPFILSQHIARSMIEQGVAGRIVNISTIGTFAAHKQQMVYNIAKAGVQAMTRGMAFELGPHGITANCIAPGAVTDRPGASTDESRGALSIWKDRIPAKRLGHADDIANAVLFMCSPASSWLTGQTLLVDGGHISYLRED